MGTGRDVPQFSGGNAGTDVPQFPDLNLPSQSKNLSIGKAYPIVAMLLTALTKYFLKRVTVRGRRILAVPRKRLPTLSRSLRKGGRRCAGSTGFDLPKREGRAKCKPSLVFHTTHVTSNLAPRIQISDHGRGRDSPERLNRPFLSPLFSIF
jgi:hypothetical protein